MASGMYTAAKKEIGDGTIDLNSDTFKVMLVTSSYTYSAAHDFRDDITNEVSGTGYSAGGAALSSPTFNVSGTTAVYDGADVTWSSSTITARGAVIYKSRGGASSADEVLFFIDFGSDKSSSSGDFTITWAAGGIAVIS